MTHTGAYPLSIITESNVGDLVILLDVYLFYYFLFIYKSDTETLNYRTTKNPINITM